jgi:hypothetical protein
MSGTSSTNDSLTRIPYDLTIFYRLILTAVLLTSKFYNDVFYGNHFVAYIGGVHLNEMNILESEFLKFLDWRLWVEPIDYDYYMNGLLQHF